MLNSESQSKNSTSKVLSLQSSILDGKVFVKLEVLDAEDVQTCRVCLKEGQIHIYGEDTARDLSEDISEFGGIVVSPDDAYPKYLCEVCHSLLRGAVTFRKTAQQSDEILRTSTRNIPTNVSNIKSNQEPNYNSNNTYFDCELMPQQSEKKNTHKTFCCDPCNLNFKTNKEYAIHRCTNEHIKQSNSKSTCSKCKKSFHRSYIKQHYKLHEQAVTVETVNEKPISNDKYYSKRDIDEEINNYSEHNHITFCCDPCNLNFKTNKEYAIHRCTNEHIKQSNTKSTCSKCKKSFHRSYIKQHYKLHEQVEALQSVNEKPISNEKYYSDRESDKKINNHSQDSKVPDTLNFEYDIKAVKCEKDSEGTFHCKPCNLDFKTNSEYYTHRRSNDHRNRKVTCKICNKSYRYMYIKYHTLLHKDKYKYICDVCGKGFKVKNTFVRHRMRHSYNEEDPEGTLSHKDSITSEHNKDEYKHMCDICGKCFKQKIVFVRHRMTHSYDDVPFKCSLCPYRGRFKEYLKLHMKSHTGEKAYKCPDCPSRSFLTKSNLNRHVLIVHTKIRNFKCEQCQRSFYTQRELKAHYYAYHTTDQTVTCQMCGNKYKNRKNLVAHELNVHKREKQRGGRMPVYLLKEKFKNTNKTGTDTEE